MTDETDAAAGSAAQRVADAVRDVPGVTGLHAGLFGEVATYLPGGRVSGVALGDDSGEVHIVVDIDHDLRTVAAAARAAGEQIVGYPLNVTVEDISTPDNSTPDNSTPDNSMDDAGNSLSAAPEARR